MAGKGSYQHHISGTTACTRNMKNFPGEIHSKPPIRTILAMEWTSGTAGCILRDVAPCAAPKIDKVIISIVQYAGIIGIEKKHTMSYLDFLRPKQQNWCGLKAEMSQVARQQAR